MTDTHPILTDLQDVHAAMTAAQLKGETDVLIRACQWLMKQVPRVMKLIEDQQMEIERKDQALRKIENQENGEGNETARIAREALFTPPPPQP